MQTSAKYVTFDSVDPISGLMSKEPKRRYHKSWVLVKAQKYFSMFLNFKVAVTGWLVLHRNIEIELGTIFELNYQKSQDWDQGQIEG